jgi:hypothetical protein
MEKTDNVRRTTIQKNEHLEVRDSWSSHTCDYEE